MVEELYIFTLLNLLDIMTTIPALRKGGFEANPIARWFIKKFSTPGLFILKYFGMGASILIAYLSNNLESILWTWNIILSLVVGWNSYANLKLRSKGR